ncbi:Acetyltransferase (GNAT) domain-containing protein [Roseomonas rosea]|uniref:Acetyltransferase (GNAT) domain-containing protein n=1 Tax=Muricoccus roseus TaxID=198092 RepID=A0A1M6NAE2_9PROT|nr:GNAT family N-acetyltransferase [Roseomonas rosea]SHJ92659.1 Acetyltransferase (GNAT) domain-containing protein [Roseomonas rosea]
MTPHAWTDRPSGSAPRPGPLGPIPQPAGLPDPELAIPPLPRLGPGFSITLRRGTGTEGAAPGPGLPGWCNRFLARPEDDFFASRAWYDTVLRHALPAGAEPLPLAPGDAALWPLLRLGGRSRALTTPYTIVWRPLPAPGAVPPALQSAGLAFGEALRHRPPVLLDALDAEAPGLAPLLDGIRAAGIMALPHDHFGNWTEALPPGQDWDGYLASRAPSLRATVLRKMLRALRSMGFELLQEPGPALEEGIAAYESVRARSWKPDEPFPAFDGALMRAAARAGRLRLGVLRLADGTAAAAQYWIVSGGGATLMKLAHDEAERATSPGTVLTALMIAHLIEEDEVRHLDFGRGDDPYKALWVRRRRQRIGMLLVDPRHPAGLLAVGRHLAGRLRRNAGRGAAPA